MQPELGREVRHRTMIQDAGSRCAPRVLRGHVLLPAAIGVVDPRVQTKFASPLFEPFRRILFQQFDRVMTAARPKGPIDRAERFVESRLPTPPQIAGQFRQFLMQRFWFRHHAILASETQPNSGWADGSIAAEKQWSSASPFVLAVGRLPRLRRLGPMPVTGTTIFPNGVRQDFESCLRQFFETPRTRRRLCELCVSINKVLKTLNPCRLFDRLPWSSPTCAESSLRCSTSSSSSSSA